MKSKGNDSQYLFVREVPTRVPIELPSIKQFSRLGSLQEQSSRFASQAVHFWLWHTLAKDSLFPSVKIQQSSTKQTFFRLDQGCFKPAACRSLPAALVLGTTSITQHLQSLEQWVVQHDASWCSIANIRFDAMQTHQHTPVFWYLLFQASSWYESLGSHHPRIPWSQRSVPSAIQRWQGNSQWRCSGDNHRTKVLEMGVWWGIFQPCLITRR